MIKSEASDHPILSIGLKRINEVHQSDRDGLAELLVAIDELAQGWLMPLGVGFQLVCCDPNEYFEEVGRPVVPHHFLRQAELPNEMIISEGFSDAACRELALLDGRAIASAIERGLEQSAPEGSVLTLSEIVWTAARVRSPVNEPIALTDGPYTISAVNIVQDGERWFAGPAVGRSSLPARLYAYNDHFVTRIVLDIYWGLWSTHPEGRAIVDAGIQRVLGRPGWEQY